MSSCGKRAWDVPDIDLEPPEESVPLRWCDRCRNWAECPGGCGWGWCSYADEFTLPNDSDDCGDFDGEPPEMEDNPAWDAIREEGNER